MKKWTSLLLTLILLLEILPLNAYAGEKRLTDKDLAAAIALTGTGEDAPLYHDGMTVDESLTSHQLTAWLDDQLDLPVHTLEVRLEDIENNLYFLSQDKPQAYSRLTGGKYAGLKEEIHNRFRDVEDLRMHLEYWKSQLNDAASDILNGAPQLTAEDASEVLSDYEIRRICYEIRQGAEQIRSIRKEMAQQADSYMAQLQEIDDWLDGRGTDAYSAILPDWITELVNEHHEKDVSRTLTASSLFPQQTTLLDRLNPVSTALADENGVVILTVMKDDQFGITVKEMSMDGDTFREDPVPDVGIQVTDAREGSSHASQVKTTSAGGTALFETDPFDLDENDTLLYRVTLSKKDYQQVIIDNEETPKGKSSVLYMQRHNNQPYIAGVSFDGRDCYYSEYEALVYQGNNRECDVTVYVGNPSDQDVQVTLVYRDAGNEAGNQERLIYRTLTDGKNDVVKAGENATLRLHAAWRSRLKAGMGTFTYLKDGQDYSTGKTARVIELLIQPADSAAAKANKTLEFKSGKPVIDDDTLTRSVELKTKAATFPKTLVDQSLTGSLFGGTASLGITSIPIFGSSKGGFMKDCSIGLGGPFDVLKCFIPRLSVTPDGTVVVVMGVDMPQAFNDDLKREPVYMSKDLKDFKKDSDKVSKNYFANQKAVWDQTRSAAKAKNNKILNTSKVNATVSVYFAMQFRMEYDAEKTTGKGTKKGLWSSTDMSVVFGINAGLDVTLSGQAMAGPIPLTFGVNISACVSAAAAIGGTISINDADKVELTDGAMRSIGLNPAFTGFSINVRLTITAFAGVGVKGVAAITLNLYFFFNVLFEFTFTKASIAVTWGAGLYLLVEALFVTYKLSIYDLPNADPVTRTWVFGETASAAPSFSDIFLSRAEAEGVDQTEPYTLTAEDYPDLVPEAEKVLDSVAIADGTMQVMEMNGTPYAFYIAEGAGSNGKNRVTWRNMVTGRTGNFDQVLKDAAEKKPRYTVHYGTHNTRKMDEYDAMYAEENAVFYGQNDMDFQVIRVDDGGEDGLLAKTYKDLYVLVVKTGNVETTDDGSIRVLDQPQVYILAFQPMGNGSLSCDLPSLDYSGQGLYTLDAITFRMLQSAEIPKFTRLSDDELIQFAPSGYAVSSFYHNPTHDTYSFGVITAVVIGDAESEIKCYAPAFKNVDDMATLVSTEYAQIIEGRQTKGKDTRHSGFVRHCYYSITEEQEDGACNLHYDNENFISMDLAEKQQIAHWDVLSGSDRDLVFWLIKEESETNGEQYHLHSAIMENYGNGNRQERVNTFTDLDVSISSLNFHIQKVRGTVYLYWLESASIPDTDQSVYRVRGVAFDPVSGITSDDFVLTQFKPPADQVISQILLTEDGYGYYVTDDNLTEPGSKARYRKSTVWRFPFQLTASVDLQMATLTQDVIGIGENDTVILKLVNNGNVAISSFDVSETLLSEDGKNDLVQTVHIDTLHPQKNYLHMDSDGKNHDNDIVGEHAAWRTKLPVEEMTQQYWQIKQTFRHYFGSDKGKVEEKEAELSVSQVLPGQVAVFVLLMKIPSSWRDELRLKFDLKGYSATSNSNAMRTAAVRSGFVKSVQAAEPEMTYVLGENGKMRLQQANLLNANGSSALYAAEVDAPASVYLDYDLHNIVVSNRIYRNPLGERRVSIYIMDEAEHRESNKWYCNVYPDGSDTPVHMELPYEEDLTSHGHTHTIDLPVSALAGKAQKQIKVEVLGIGVEESTLQDNYFYIDLEYDDPLRIVLQPENVVVEPGATAKFFVMAAGGRAPYSYQWQISDGKGGWKDLDGATSDTLTLEKVTAEMNDSQYRCVVTDFNSTSVTSAAALLTVVKKVPQTGDTAEPILWAFCVLLGIAGTVLFLRKKKRR